MLVRQEVRDDAEPIRRVHASAFATISTDSAPPEVGLVDALRACDAWIPELSIVAVDDNAVIGHVACTRAWVNGRDALGLGPLGVLREHHRRGVGSALMHAVLGAADAMHEPLVVLLGHPGYYPRFGFVLADTLGIEPPVPEWAPHFQARTLTHYDAAMRGTFAYAQPFNDL
jgi:putative acetyltransferase